MKSTNQKNLKHTIKKASEVYKEFSDHLQKNNKVILKHEDLEQWWNGYKRALEELLEDEKKFEFENKILRIKKDEKMTLIIPKNYYSQSGGEATKHKANSWAKYLRKVGNNFLRLLNK